ncbi:hypothetical protein PG996_015925 [Apiospora saccharicola]|uniref:F-box domain-containing protein n=1 Tax=Apiospora saccharicola TaxID=335842 RepID=A0ABR1TMF9_9PEZI
MAQVVKQQVQLMDFPVEILETILEYTGLVTPHGIVYWSSRRGFYIQADPSSRRNFAKPTPVFLVNRDFRDMATRIFFRNNAIVLKQMSHTSLAMETPIRFLHSIVPPQALQFITTLTMKVKMVSHEWSQAAGVIAPRLTSLRTLTIVGQFNQNNNVYDFGAEITLDHLRTLVEQHLWPINQLSACVRQVAVHFHSGAGMILPGMWVGRIPGNEPTYFIEHKDTPENKSFRSSLVNGTDCLFRSHQCGDFIEGTVRFPLVEALINGRF